MRHVLVFATSVDSALAARSLRNPLDRLVGPSGWNFDLDDCDRVLRVIHPIDLAEIVQLLHDHGFQCRELGDEILSVEESITQKMVS